MDRTVRQPELEPKGKTNTRFPTLGDQVPRAGSRILAKIARGILTLFGWRLEGEFPNRPKMVIIAAPHTSNWDWVLAMLIVWSIRLKFQWLGKHSLFEGTLGGMFRACGGIPVDRTAPKGVVNQIADRIRSEEQIMLALAPEGTRRHVERFKSGFYHIAYAAGVPIFPVRLDYERRVLYLLPLVFPSGDAEREIREIEALYGR